MISAIRKENKTQVTHSLEDLFQIFNARAREISSPDRVQLEECHDIPTHAKCTTDAIADIMQRSPQEKVIPTISCLE